MGIPHSFTKTLAAAAVGNIAASQSPGAGAILINGTASNRVSTTTTAAAAAGALVLALTTVTGIVAGSSITDSTAAVIPAGTTVIGVDTANSKVILSQPVGGAGVGNGDTIVITGPAVLDTQRRVNFPSNASDNSAIVYTITGTSDNGTSITDSINGPGVTNAVITNLDFKTITSITHTGTIVGAITIGTTSGAGLPGNPLPAASTPWFGVNWHAQPFEVQLSGIIGAGVTCNYTWQYTYDDPNNLPPAVLFPQPFNHPTLNNQAASLDGSINDPVAAVRLVVNSGSGVRGTWMEAGISGQ